MTLFRHTAVRHTAVRHTTAALLAACLGASCANAAFAAGDDADLAPASAAEGQAHGRAPDGEAPDGFGGPRPGAPGLATPSHHGGPPPHAGFGPFGPFGPIGPIGRLRHLDLSEAQQDKLFAITHAAAPQQREQEKAERKAHEALHAFGASARFDEAGASAAARDLGQAVATGALLRARLASQVLALLTPEQRDRLRQEGPPDPQARPGRP